MPRPQRIRDRERAIAGEAPAEAGDGETPLVTSRKEEIGLRRTLRIGRVEVIEPEEQAPVDNARQVEQSGQRGQVADGENPETEVARRVARKMGWVPKEEWTRNPESWTDAPEFLEYTPKRLEALQERQRRMGQVAEDQAEQARREAREETRRELDAAIHAGDTETAIQAADRLAKNVGPPPQTVAWIARNGWFHADPDAQVIAANAMRRAERAGATIEEQLQAGEVAARKRFPEHFDDIQPFRREEPSSESVREPRREVRLSEVRPPAPSLAEGSRSGGGRTQPKEKGWMDIPSVDRSQMQQFVKRALRKGQTEKQATDFLAASYWGLKSERGAI